jgi:hypothetical protein
VLILSGETSENRINSGIGTRTRSSHVEVASRNFESPSVAFHDRASTTMSLFSTHAIAGFGTYSSSTILKKRTKTGILPSFRLSFKLPGWFPSLGRPVRLSLLPGLSSFSRCFLTNYSRKSTGPITKVPFERIASQ